MPQLKEIQPNQRPRKPKKKKKKAMPASHRDAPVTRYLDDDDCKAGGSGDGGGSAQGWNCDHDGWFWIKKRFLMVFGFDDDIQASCISSTHLPVQPSGFYQRIEIKGWFFFVPSSNLQFRSHWQRELQHTSLERGDDWPSCTAQGDPIMGLKRRWEPVMGLKRRETLLWA